MKPMFVLGIMSGTSMDGVDYALCEVTACSVSLLKHWQREFPKALRHRLHAAAANESSAYELARLHHDLGRLYAQQAKQLRCRAELAGLHGQTVFHNPNRQAPATLQIGEPAYLAETLHIPVVSDFRVADMAAGGQGAPLATLFHKVAFAKRGEHICVNNLGGISNVTSLDWRRGTEPRVAAFDTGPGNVLIDLAMRDFTRGRQSFDRDGAWAERGCTDERLLNRWLNHRFFRQSPPKSTGRECFGEPFWQAALGDIRGARLARYDVLATLTELTARSIALNYQLHLKSLPDTVVLCGGGAKNVLLRKRISVALRRLRPGLNVTTSQRLAWPPQSIEPAAFALLAYYRWNSVPANLPAATGASRPVLLGHISYPG